MGRKKKELTGNTFKIAQMIIPEIFVDMEKTGDTIFVSSKTKKVKVSK